MQPKLIRTPSAADMAILPVPPIYLSRHVCCKLMSTVGARRAESGGILLGPIGSNDVTDFYFDDSALCTGSTYSPDHLTLKRKMKEVWMPAGVDMKGFAHSHPGTCARLSAGDMIYIRRLLEINPDMSVFAAPIVIPQAFRLEAIVVLADQPHIQRPTYFRLF
jgi:proteasome lid subunit RPN8/RPN11